MVFEGSGYREAPPIDIKALHAKIGEPTLENDFLEAALTKAGLLSAFQLEKENTGSSLLLSAAANPGCLNDRLGSTHRAGFNDRQLHRFCYSLVKSGLNGVPMLLGAVPNGVYLSYTRTF